MKKIVRKINTETINSNMSLKSKGIENKFKRLIKNPFIIINSLKNRIFRFFKLHLLNDEFTVAVTQWFKDEGDKNLRLTYPLTSKSIIFDVGGFEGDFAADIHNKYGCFVYVFEPINKYYLHCLNRFRGNNMIKCFNYGLSNENGSFLIGVDNDGSSLIKNTSSNSELVSIKSFSDEITSLNVVHIDLLKINIEGSEFILLPHIISNDLMSKIKHLQIQFHTFFPNAKILRDEIREKLGETHVEEWNYPFVWESWKRKN
jgi:FkbM family methyltransferase